MVPNTGPFYTLPDLGYADGRSLYLVGREDEVLNADGNKVAFSVIEAALRDLPGVRDVGIAAADAIGEPGTIVIGLVAEDDFDMKAATDAVVTVAKTPAVVPIVHIFRCDAISRNATGKIDRKALVSTYVLTRAVRGLSR